MKKRIDLINDLYIKTSELPPIRNADFTSGDCDLLMEQYHNQFISLTPHINELGKFQVKISEIIEMEKWKRGINNEPLSRIEFLDDEGGAIVIDDKIISEFQFLGLINTDFILFGFHERGLDNS